VNPNNGTEITSNLLRALSHSGGYVAAAYRDTDAEVPVGAIISFVARHQNADGTWDVHLHSHMNAVLPEHRDAGIGTLLKLDQRAWALENGIATIAWTFDPLVRRNLRINILKLGIDLHSYEPNFYGLMADDLNAGDETDRLIAWWELQSESTMAALAGQVNPLREIPEDAIVVEIPADIISLRKQNPDVALEWRYRVRSEIQAALASGRTLLGLTNDDFYVFGWKNAN
jgi:predicted GNAT superfamily acetyltransferase